MALSRQLALDKVFILSDRVKGWADDLRLKPQDYVLTRSIFLRLLGTVYLIAFLSLAVQITGLVGEEGILPARQLLVTIQSHFGAASYWSLPTLAWLSPSDLFLQYLAWAGVILALLLIFGQQTTLVLALLWTLYLSLMNVGQDFLSFQWDALLVETGFLAIFLVSPSLIRPRPDPPRPIIIWLFRWLLFRLMFLSGVVKIASGDPTWRDLTAMTYHYQTQPLPTPLAWFVHHLPAVALKLSTLATFLIELVVPFAIFGPRLIRLMSGALFLLFGLLITLTGNFTFFILLTASLVIFLGDDRFFGRFLPLPNGRLGTTAGPSYYQEAGLTALATVLVATSLSQLIAVTSRWRFPEEFMTPVRRLIEPFHLVNRYGLFAVMTTRRPEIILEGSEDGDSWRGYEFFYKPGDLTRPPPIVAPHQPRLDWQMWFAALSSPKPPRWFGRFVHQLLAGSPEVFRLLKGNPFPRQPPKFIRAQLYDYEFTNKGEREVSGAWWRRSYRGEYLPSVTLP